MADTVKIAGLQQLGANLRELADVTARKICGQATGAAARIVKEEVKAIIRRNVDPKHSSGSLEAAVIVKKLPKGDLGGLTAAHIVTPRHKRTKRQRKNKQKYPVAPHALFPQFGTVNMPAEPYLDKGLLQARTKAEQAMKDALQRGIDRAARRLKK
jgi:HK97 gp10 family phage protein